MPVIVIGADAVTVISKVPVTAEPSLAVAVTVTVPAPVPVNTPVVASIVADPVTSVTDHVTLGSVASAGKTAALIARFPPSATVVALPAPVTVIEVTGVGADAVTVISKVPVTAEPSLAVAVTVTVPAPVPVNTCLLYTSDAAD